MKSTKIPKPVLKADRDACGVQATFSGADYEKTNEEQEAERPAENCTQPSNIKPRKVFRIPKALGRCFGVNDSEKKNKKSKTNSSSGKDEMLPVEYLETSPHIRGVFLVSTIPNPNKHRIKAKSEKEDVFAVAGSASAKLYEVGITDQPYSAQEEEDAEFDAEVDRVIKALMGVHTGFSMFAERKCPEGWVNTAKYRPYNPKEVIGKVPKTDPYETICFPRPTNQPSSSPFVIQNPSTSRKLAFKMQVNKPKYFFARPCAGLILPGQTIELQIAFKHYHLEQPPVNFKPLFRLMAAFIPRDAQLISESEDTILLLFRDMPKRQRMGAIFKVQFPENESTTRDSLIGWSDEFKGGNSLIAASPRNSGHNRGATPTLFSHGQQEHFERLLNRPSPSCSRTSYRSLRNLEKLAASEGAIPFDREAVLALEENSGYLHIFFPIVILIVLLAILINYLG